MENNNYLVEEKKGRATRYYVVLSSSRVDVEDSPSRQRTATGKGSEDSAGDLVCSPRLCFIRLAIYNYNNITLPPPPVDVSVLRCPGRPPRLATHWQDSRQTSTNQQEESEADRTEEETRRWPR